MSQFKVRGDKLDNIKSSTNLKHGNKSITPRYIAIHYTAGSTLKSSIDHLKRVGYSYHILIDRDGSVVQGVPLSKRAFHAGASNWKGRDSLNDWAIGISLANIGYLKRHSDQFFNLDNHGQPVSPSLELEDVLVSTHPNGHVGNEQKGWEVYTDAQYETVNAVIEALIKAFPDITDAIGHDEIAVGRKPDPGPAFDWGRIHHLFPQRERDTGPLYRVRVRQGDNLNIRSGPNGKWPVIAKLKSGTPVHVRSYGYKYVNNRAVKTEWASIAREGELKHLGFVHASYLSRV